MTGAAYVAGGAGNLIADVKAFGAAHDALVKQGGAAYGKAEAQRRYGSKS